MIPPSKSTQFSNPLFTRLYFVLIVSIIIIGSGLEYILNKIDDTDSISYIKKLNNPVFQLISQQLRNTNKEQWTELIKTYNSEIEHPISLMWLADFAADEDTLRQLSDGDMLVLFDVDDSVTLYQRIVGTKQVIAKESSLPEQIDQRAWVLPAFYLSFALVLYMLIRPFAKQLLQLKQAAIDLGLGDFSARVEVPASTTLAPIADAFNAMTKKIERLLLTQRDLVNSVSHELRTPLARLKFGFEEVSLLTEEQSFNQTVSAMKEDVSELELLIDEMLRYAEVNQIKAFTKSAVNIKKMIETSVSYHTNEKIEVLVGFNPDIKDDEMMLCHEMSLNRALSNVIRNAISFANTRCAVSVHKNNNDLMIDICDDGVGLKGVDHDRIFEPFFKLANKYRKPGYGLGLSIAQTIAQKHNGSLRVVEGSLPGACFQFRIPLK